MQLRIFKEGSDDFAEPWTVSRIAFPDDQNIVPKVPEGFLASYIPLPVPNKLLRPVARIGSRLGCKLAGFMGMPEAAVDKYRPSSSLIGQIGLAWKVRDMNAKSHAKGMHC